MERKIGEIFEYNGEWYQCINKGFSCADCDIKGDCSSTYIGACSSRLRKDGKQVRFKKLEKVGEPIEFTREWCFQKYQLADSTAFYEGEAHLVFTAPIKMFVYIEIKQNKEDMEENKLNLKPFDIQKAREGKPVYTRDGRKARIICFDRISGDDYYKIVACVTAFDEDFEEVLFYGIDGYIVDSQNPKDEDLMMLPEKKEGWVNLPKDTVYFDKKEIAERNCLQNYFTVKIEWEE